MIEKSAVVVVVVFVVLVNVVVVLVLHVVYSFHSRCYYYGREKA